MRQAGLDLQPLSAGYVSLSIQGDLVTIRDAVWTAIERDDALADEDLPAFEALGADALADAEVPDGEVVLGLPGRDAIIRYVHLPPLPGWRLDLLMGDEVREVEEKAGEPLCADHCLLTIPDGMLSPTALDVSVLVALAKERPVASRIRALEVEGLSPGRVCPRPVALFDAWVGVGHTSDTPTLLIDAGAEGTELVLTRDGLLLFARSLPPLEGVREAPLGAAGQLARAVQGSLSFARTQQQLAPFEVGAVRLSGALSGDPAALAALARALKVDVVAFSPWERIDLASAPQEVRETIDEHGADLVIACGLALVGVHPRSVALDLVPRAVERQRRFWNRTAWLLGAAAVLLLALLVSGVRALGRRADARARGRELAVLESDLRQRLDRVEEIERQNRDLAVVLNGLAHRAQPGAASAWLLGALRRAVPRTVTLQTVRLESSSQAPPATGLVTFSVSGEADNATGEGTHAMAAFERALRHEPQVAAAKVTGTPVERPGATLAFTLQVSVRPLGGEGGS